MKLIHNWLLKGALTGILIVFKVVFIFLSLCFSLSSLSVRAQTDYKIGPEDVLQIAVYEEEDLSLDVRVSSEGFITYPLLGRIEVADLTVHELESKITELLGQDYLVNPQVTVFIKEYSNVFISGEVNKPGQYSLVPNTTLMTALSMSGGLTEFADRNRVVVIRKEGESKKVFEISILDITEQGLKEKDIELKPNDVIQVKRYENVYVLGQVNKPGEYILKGKLTVVEAISLAGGLTKIAAPNKTRVIRNENGVQKVIEIPVGDILKTGDQRQDVVLDAKDVIMVPESFF